MEKLARRMVIIFLSATVFGFSIAALVQSRPPQMVRFDVATSTSCLFAGGSICASVN